MVCPLLILLDKMKGNDQGGPIPHNLYDETSDGPSTL